MTETKATPGRIAVVGGGIAGVTAVRELRQAGYIGAVTLIDRGEHPYDRPPLSKAVLLGESDLDAIRLVPEKWFEENDVRLLAGRDAVRLRPGEGTVELDDGSVVAADAVLVTTGGAARPLSVPGGDLPGVHVLRTEEDARGLKAALLPGARIVVVGGGLIGAEVAASALALGCEVTLVEPVAPPLAAAVGAEIATLLHAQHGAAGIGVVADTVARVGGGRTGLSVVTGSGESLPADAVVAGVGLTVPTELAESAGLETDRGIVVDAEQRTSHPAVYAAGDVAVVRRPDGILHRSEHWHAAQQGARTAAAAMLGLPLPAREPEWFWTDRHGVHVEAVGDMSGPRRVVRGEAGAFPLTVFSLAEDGRLLGAAAVDDNRAIAAARRLIQAGRYPAPGLLADVSVNPRAWLRS